MIKSINTYYTTKEKLESFINDEKIQNSSSLLIQVFSSINEKTFISTLLSELTQFLPDAVIIGTTTDGEIIDGKVTSGKVVLSFTQFEHTTLKAAAIEHKVDGYYSGQYLAKELIDEDTKLLIAFVDGLHTNGEEFLSGIDSVNDKVVIAGGHAGDNGNFTDTLVFTKEHIFEYGAVGVTLNSKHLHVHEDYSFNWHSIGNELTITKAEGNRVYTIDGRSAVDTYAYYLGEDIAKGLPAIGIEFPLIVNRNGSNVSRTSIAKEDDGSLIVGGNLYTGEKVRIGYGDRKEVLRKSKKILDTTSQKPSEVIFVYSCSTRKYFMGDEIEVETLPLQAIAPVSGFFTYGEFFTSDKKELFNQTMTLVSLSESDAISKTTLDTHLKQLDENSSSIDALTRLINMTSKEVQEQTKTLKAGNQLKKEHRERMELAFKGTNEGIWDWNILDNTVFFCPRWKEMLGYRDVELINEVSTWSDRIHPADVERTWEDVYKNVNGETEYYENIHRLKHKDGHWVWILDRGKTQYDENGKAIRMIGTHIDITEEKEKEKQTNINSTSINGLTHLINITSDEVKEQGKILKESNHLNQQLRERMELALSGSKTSVLDWNFTDDSIYISPSWKEMLGYTDKELPNTLSSWADRVHRDDQKKVLSLLRKQQSKKIKYFENTHRLKHKNGHWVWVLGRAQILYDGNGKKIRMIGTHTDITEEKELQLKYFYQSQMIEQINDSVTTTDLQGNIVSWNLGSEKTFGYKADEVIGKSIAILYREEDIPSLQEYVGTLMKTGVYNADLSLVKKSKELIPISFSLSLLRDENGNPTGIVGINKDNTQRKKAEDALYEQKNILRYQAHHDALTGLPNRVLFQDRLEQGIEKSKRHQVGLGLFFIDLDKFKHINDSLGHVVGDSVLKLVAKRLAGIIRKEDTLARLSGDEFTVIMEELTQPEDASLLAEKILEVLAEPMHIDDYILYVSGSIGISLYPQDAADAQYLLKYADTAMYKAKEEGRNNFQFYSSDMTEFALEHMALKTSLRQAIDNGEFIIHYQPQISTCTNRLVGLEALVRWEHPTMGTLAPNTFIPLAEETGMIVEIDHWVMETAMQQIAKWNGAGLKPGVLALNISTNQLESTDFFQKIEENMKRYGFKSKWLELEITEGQMLKKPEEVIEKLEKINNLGIGVSIDDFGTGYSSLSLLKRLPINRLKIDQSFIKDIPKDEEDVAIVKAILALAGSLKLDLIAEGVETLAQRDFLIENGCINIQGNYYSPPVPAKEMKEILLKNSYWI
ncbi:EAL domain-containing protein [Sulfurovum sp. CS9]|uniref:bifunctional diguanylate cyclase/phosphodiesterase n=1 Tax=Sulfurovum sp. CS9 TaxID=3391146 RepID=UPI0039EBCD99